MADIYSLNLTPQEENIYQHHLGNLTGPGGVENPDKTVSTVKNVGFEQDGKYYNVPSVWEGKIHEPTEAIDRANKIGIENFPSYSSQKEAEARYNAMHDFMETDIKMIQGIKDLGYTLNKVDNPPEMVGLTPVDLIPDAPNQFQAAFDRADKSNLEESFQSAKEAPLKNVDPFESLDPLGIKRMKNLVTFPKKVYEQGATTEEMIQPAAGIAGEMLRTQVKGSLPKKFPESLPKRYTPKDILS